MTLYQKALNVYGMLRNAIDSRMSKYDIASQFDSSVRYGPGDLVIYQDKLYECESEHYGEWGGGGDFTQATVSEAISASVRRRVEQATEGMALRTDLADEFSPIVSYGNGRMVVYEGVLYRCVNDHSGAWGSGADFVEATVDETLDYVKGLIMDQAAAQFTEKADIAGQFDPDTAYEPGDLVVYNGGLYRCIGEYSGSGAWDPSRFRRYDAVNSVLKLKANMSEVQDALDQKASTADVSALLTQKADLYDLGMNMHIPGQWMLSASGIAPETLAELGVVWDQSGQSWNLVYKDDPTDVLASVEDPDGMMTSLTFEVEIGEGDVTVVANKSENEQLMDRCVNVIFMPALENAQDTHDYYYILPERRIGKSRQFDVLVNVPTIAGAATQPAWNAYIFYVGHGYPEGDEEDVSFLTTSADGFIPYPNGTRGQFLLKFKEVSDHTFSVDGVQLFESANRDNSTASS